MRSTSLGASAIAASTWVAVLAGSPAAAQTPGCRIVEMQDPPRQVLHCADGLTLTAEQDTAFRLVGGKAGRPRAADLTDHGLLIEAPAGALRGGFQVRTPHALAAVRGTVWAIDVGDDGTAVFVERGTVSVRRADRSGKPVRLHDGDGVDVQAAGGPLQVKRWGAARARTLLARFGR